MGAISFSLDEKLLLFFKQELRIKVFVETGTFRGETLELARRHFDECFSVELSDHYFAEAARRFAGVKGVILENGASPECLKRLQLILVGRPVLFWLDAHWCSGEGTAGEHCQSPLKEELQSIGPLHAQSVVLIDDARLYLAPPPAPHRLADWPDFQEILHQLQLLSSTHRLMVLNDVMVFYPASISTAFTEFAQGCGVDWHELVRSARKHEKRKTKAWWRLGQKPR